jgi:DNA-binding transcriptional LysR family regulator
VTLHQLKLFLSVAKHKSIKAASEDLRTAQPSISRQLQLLADELGVSLHRRVGRGIELTPAGSFLAKEATLIVARIEAINGLLRGASVKKQKADQLTIGGSYSPSVSLLPSLLARFKKSHPHVNLSLRSDNRVVIERLILERRVDFAVVNNPMPHQSLVIEPYCFEPAVAFVAANHPLAKRRRVDANVDWNIGLIIRKSHRGKGMGERFLDHLRKHGFNPQVMMYCDSPEAIKTAVAKSFGIGILPKSLIEKDIKRGTFKAIKLPGEVFEVKTSIVYRKGKLLSAIEQEFLTLMRRVIKPQSIMSVSYGRRPAAK